MNQYPMFTQIVDDRTFIVGDKQYSAGDKVDLTPTETDDLATIRKLDADLRALRQDLINKTHETDLTFLPEIVADLHELSIMGTALRVAIPQFIMGLSKRMGGRLPVELDATLTELTVRERRQGESINYTVPTALDILNLGQIREQRELAFALAGNRTATKIEAPLDREYGFQPVTINVAGSLKIGDAVRSLLKKFPRPMTVSMIISGDGCDKSYVINPFETQDRQRKDHWPMISTFCQKMACSLIVIVHALPTKGQDGWNILCATLTKEKGKLKTVTDTYFMGSKGELLQVNEDSREELRGFEPANLVACLKET